jgi:CBS domain-containing protein
MNQDSALHTRRLEGGTSIVQARPWQAPPVRPDSPAIEVMTDLTLVKAATIGAGVSLRQAEQVMIYQGVRMLFVVDDMPALEGLITTTDLRGDRVLRATRDRGLHYDDLAVADAMTPLAMLDAIDLDAMRTATVSNVVATLQRHGRNHLLVAEPGDAPGTMRVRGVVSRAQIERQLGQPIVLTEVANSFADLGRMLG